MRLYIDQENIISLMGAKYDFERMFFLSSYIKLIKRWEVYYNFDRDNIDMSDETNKLGLWFRLLGTDGIKGCSTFLSKEKLTPSRPLKSNFDRELDKEQLSAIFLLNVDESISDEIQQRKAVLFGKVGEEQMVLNSVLDLIEKHPNKFLNQIKDWKDICPQFPLTDIILRDPYIFKVYRTEVITDLIEAVVGNHKSPIKMVLFYNKDNVDAGLDLEEEYKRIKQFLMDISQNKKSKVTFVSTFDLHDRYLITNYYIISSGSGFNRERPSKDDVNVSIEPFAGYKQKLSDFVSKSQHILDIKKGEGCIGDKSSNFLVF